MPHDWQAPECRWLGLDVNADVRVFGHEGRERLLQGTDPAIAIATMAETYREIVGSLLPALAGYCRGLAGGRIADAAQLHRGQRPYR